MKRILLPIILLGALLTPQVSKSMGVGSALVGPCSTMVSAIVNPMYCKVYGNTQRFNKHLFPLSYALLAEEALLANHDPQNIGFYLGDAWGATWAAGWRLIIPRNAQDNEYNLEDLEKELEKTKENNPRIDTYRFIISQLMHKLNVPNTAKQHAYLPGYFALEASCPLASHYNVLPVVHPYAPYIWRAAVLASMTAHQMYCDQQADVAADKKIHDIATVKAGIAYLKHTIGKEEARFAGAQYLPHVIQLKQRLIHLQEQFMQLLDEKELEMLSKLKKRK